MCRFSLLRNLWMFLESLWLQMTLLSWLMLSLRPMLVMESWATKALDWSLTMQDQVRICSSLFFIIFCCYSLVCAVDMKVILVDCLNLINWSLCFQRSSWPETSSSTRVWELYALKETLWELKLPKPLQRLWRTKTCFRCFHSSPFPIIVKHHLSLGFDC